MKYQTPIHDDSKCLYIYTLPKSGTYLLASLCEDLGIKNSGRHIGFHEYLNIYACSPDVSRNQPSRTGIRQPYIQTFRQSRGQLAFGHLSPSFLPPSIFQSVQVIVSFRTPLEILVSEFNDFRFIRSDVDFCSIREEPNDAKAFALYLQAQAHVIRDIMIEMARYLDCFCRPLYAQKYKGFVPIVIDYNRLRDDDYCSWLHPLFARLVPNKNFVLASVLEETFKKETKTKSQGYCFDVNQLWSSSHLEIIKPLQLERLHRYIRKQEAMIRSCLQGIS